MTSAAVARSTPAQRWLARLSGGSHPAWGLVTLLTAMAIAGGWAGARLAARSNTGKLQAAFTVLLVLVAGYTAWRVLPTLTLTTSHFA